MTTQMIGPAAPWKCRTASIPRRTMNAWASDSRRKQIHPPSDRLRKLGAPARLSSRNPGIARDSSAFSAIEAR
jgi:hypothetical protein